MDRFSEIECQLQTSYSLNTPVPVPSDDFTTNLVLHLLPDVRAWMKVRVWWVYQEGNLSGCKVVNEFVCSVSYVARSLCSDASVRYKYPVVFL